MSHGPLAAAALTRRVAFDPKVFALSSDQSIDQLLTDIPFFSVGLLSFGVFTAFIILRRVNGLSTYVYVSTLLAFVAAILDLTQLLLRGSLTSEQGVKLASLSGVIVLRELLFALSVGFRFLFFWTLVGDCPRGETPVFVPTSTGGYETHSGEWSRWGIFGKVLQWFTFFLITAITILQIVWRIVPTLRTYGPVYFVDNAIEIVVSSLFMMKMITSTLTTSDSWEAIKGFSAPFVAILIGFGIAIGNFVYFEFSEFTLGRFLQALELYLLIVYILVTTFYHARIRDSITSFGSVRDLTRAFPFTEKVREPSFDLKPMPKDLNEDPHDPDGLLNLYSKRFSSDYAKSKGINIQREVWEQQGDAEFGILPPGLGERSQSRFDDFDDDEYEAPPPRRINKRNAPKKQPSIDLIKSETKTAYTSSRGQSLAISIDSYYASVGTDRPPVPSVPATALPPPSSFVESPAGGFAAPQLNFLTVSGKGPVPQSRMSMMTTMTDSPVYGLDGIRAKEEHISVNSFEAMLLQQSELDKSIAALRLISPVETTFEELAESTPSTSNTDSNTRARQKSVASVASDFSLKMFPIPPMRASDDVLSPEVVSATVVPMPKAAPVAFITPLKKRNGSREENIPPPITIPIQTLTSPVADIATPPDARRSRLNVSSSGTQYDVTSFIGDLTGPTTGITSAMRTGQFEDSPVVDKGLRSGAVSKRPGASSLRLNSAALKTGGDGDIPSPLASLGPATASSGLLSSVKTSKLPAITTTNIPEEDEDASDLLDGLIVRDAATPLNEVKGDAITTIPVSASLGTGDATKKSTGLPPRPRLAGPRPLTSLHEKTPSK